MWFAGFFLRDRPNRMLPRRGLPLRTLRSENSCEFGAAHENACPGGICIHEGDKVDEAALKDLIRVSGPRIKIGRNSYRR